MNGSIRVGARAHRAFLGTDRVCRPSARRDRKGGQTGAGIPNDGAHARRSALHDRFFTAATSQSPPNRLHLFPGRSARRARSRDARTRRGDLQPATPTVRNPRPHGCNGVSRSGYLDHAMPQRIARTLAPCVQMPPLPKAARESGAPIMAEVSAPSRTRWWHMGDRQAGGHSPG